MAQERQDCSVCLGRVSWRPKGGITDLGRISRKLPDTARSVRYSLRADVHPT
jgi:hypothetical protein